MKVEVTEEVILLDNHPVDYYDKLNNEWVCIYVNGEKASVKIDTLIKALELMRER